MQAEKAEICMICLEDSKHRSTYTCGCCGKSLCKDCEVMYSHSLAMGMGCPCCRSTMGVVHIVINLLEMDSVILRLDGNNETFQVSVRALRKYDREFKNIQEEFQDRVRSVENKTKLHMRVACSARDVIQSFLSNHVLAKRSYIKNRFDKGTVKAVFAIFS